MAPRGAARVLMMGAHVLRAGTQRHVIDLMERGLVSLIAMNGAGPIHDWELALIGATTESVARYVSSGEFGLWRETGRINDVVRDGYGPTATGPPSARRDTATSSRSRPRSNGSKGACCSTSARPSWAPRCT